MNKQDITGTNAAKTLAQVDLSSFERGMDGFPHPGKVVKYYREQMTYTDKDGSLKHWTQAELGQKLGLSETMVNHMERHNKGLDSIGRRRTLATLLKIPPALLGLGSLDQIVECATGIEAPETDVSKDQKNLQYYQDTFQIYSLLFAQGLTKANLKTIIRQTQSIEQKVKNNRREDRNALLRTLWDYEILCTKIHASDFACWDEAFKHVNNAIALAEEIGDRDLQAVSMYIAGLNYVRQGRLGLARAAIDAASMYAKGALPQTRGAIYSLDAFYYTEQRGVANATVIHRLLDMAEQHAGAKTEGKTVKFGKGSFYLHKAEALIDLGRPGKALEYLEDAERYIHPSKKKTFDVS